MRIALFATGLAIALVAAPPAAAQAGNKDKPKSGPDVQVKVTLLRDVELRLVREHYAEPGKRPKGLPAGIARNLARGKPLPPGIARTRLPDPLRARLTLSPDRDMLLLGDALVLVDRAGLVVDFKLNLFL